MLWQILVSLVSGLWHVAYWQFHTNHKVMCLGIYNYNFWYVRLKTTVCPSMHFQTSSASWSRIRFCSIASPLCCLQNRSSELFHPATHSVFFSVLSFIVGWSSFSKPGPPSPTPFSLTLSLLLYFWNMKEVINHSELKITLNLIYQILS